MFFSESDDDSLMAEIATGNERAFRKLFDRHSGKVLGYAKRLVGGDSVLAEDISQILWIKVVQAAPHYRGEGHFIAWVYTLIRNAALTELKKRSREDVEDFETLETTNFEKVEAACDKESIEAELIRKSEHDKLKVVLDRLPEMQRKALIIWLTEDVGYDEMAKVLNLSVSAVKSLLFRARERVETEMRREK